MLTPIATSRKPSPATGLGRYGDAVRPDAIIAGKGGS
jgi:hypothetical protein